MRIVVEKRNIFGMPVSRVVALFFTLCVSIHVFGLGYTPTDCGLVVNLKPGDRILLSTWIDVNGNGTEDPGEEFFVNHYNGYTGGRFGYGSGDFLKLIPQDAGATNPSPVSVWTVDTALVRPNRALGGISYTMWSSSGYTLVTSDGSFKTKGNLSKNRNANDLCDVVFVIPTNHPGITSLDPKNTMGRTDLNEDKCFNGAMGTGFMGMTYREVFWLDIARLNNPITYTNASLVTFNTTTSTVKWNGENTSPGRTYYAFAEDKHKDTKRTLFRLYILNNPFNSCPDSYFFGYDEQDYKRYRLGPDNKDYTWAKLTDSTAAKKTYTEDRFECMSRIGGTQYYETDYRIPYSDSVYYFVGYGNAYKLSGLGSNNAKSQFAKIGSLPVKNHAAEVEVAPFTAPKGAYGRIIVDTTSTADNLNPYFHPAGVFLRTNSDFNVEMMPEGDTAWITKEMWYIDASYEPLSIKATLLTGPAFRLDDPGADVPGWSEYYHSTEMPVYGKPGETSIGKSGWARVRTQRTREGGKAWMEFVIADDTRRIIYDNNGYFGTKIPDQHPKAGETTVVVEQPRLVSHFKFAKWTTNADGTGEVYQPGQQVTLNENEELRLYAQAEYTGVLQMAVSFIHPTDGKRYFLTHPAAEAPRFARARHFEDFTNVTQGMKDAQNSDPTYLSTYATAGAACRECDPLERGLDPKQDTMRIMGDSLVFYEEFAPNLNDYVGLYYTEPNTILANNTWGGMFKSTKGWPDYRTISVQNTLLYSDHYVRFVTPSFPDHPAPIDRYARVDSTSGEKIVMPPYVKYKPATNQFDGVEEDEDPTVFDLSAITVVDAHFVVLPDTINHTWPNDIVYAYHRGEQREEDIWSQLIGKHLKAAMTIGNDTVYFHPDRNAILTTPSELRLSSNYRLTQTFEYIHDQRIEDMAQVVKDDKPVMYETGDDFHRVVVGGVNSPMDVIYNGEYINIVDTIRITLRPMGTSRIKEYYGRWKKKSEDDGLHVNPDGSRYRDILVTTRTFHYGDTVTKIVLKPQYPNYNLSPLANASQSLRFTLARVVTRQLLDKDGYEEAEEILSSTDLTSGLRLSHDMCSFVGDGGTRYEAPAGQSINDYVTLRTLTDNSTSGIYYDTLVVRYSYSLDTVVEARVPLAQPNLEGAELVWSVEHEGKRYFIMGRGNAFLFRQYTLRGNKLTQLNSYNELRKGIETEATPDNQRDRYLTPWTYAYQGEKVNQQLTLKTQTDGETEKYFAPNGGNTAPVLSESESIWTYEYDTVYVNDNANFEERVRLRFGEPETGWWLQFNLTSGTPSLSLTTNKEQATVFSWTYLQPEYYLANKGEYPDHYSVEFGYNTTTPDTVQTRYKAFKQYSILLNNQLTYCGREDEEDIKDLTDPDKEWKTMISFRHIPDGSAPSGLRIDSTTQRSQLKTIITPIGDSPAGTHDVVDMLEVTVGLQEGAPKYRFADAWRDYESVDNAHLWIPLNRKVYNPMPYDSLLCTIDADEHHFAFPAVLGASDSLHTFVFRTERRLGTNIMDAQNHVESFIPSDVEDWTGEMHFDMAYYAEIRLIDKRGSTPDWCRIESKGANTVQIKCLRNGSRTPRSADLYLVYVVPVVKEETTIWRYVNFRMRVTQASIYQLGNQSLVHSRGASGDTLDARGLQQVHENRRVLYYYNPACTPEADQDTELPIRERGFYGWWRWYEDKTGNDLNIDIPEEVWVTPPTNVGKDNKRPYPFRIIGGKVPVNPEDPENKDSITVTQGRYTVFYHPSKEYDRNDPPSKNTKVVPPSDKSVKTYVVDLSNYYDNLPLSMTAINQIDTAKLDTMKEIIEPTLSLREIFELHPWTEMADTMEHYKFANGTDYKDETYMEDHVVRAPIGSRLLLKTEQRYNYANLQSKGLSESLLGYYMKDDNWNSWSEDPDRQDTMIWVAGWDAKAQWYTHTKTGGYKKCDYSVTVDDDFLNVPARQSIPSGKTVDTVVYCLRAQSKKSPVSGPDPEEPADGDFWFNICRYTVIYHRPAKYGPLLEASNGAGAIITDDEIEQNFEVLERLNFDYYRTGRDYQVYPHPLPWTDASYGYSYPMTDDLPDNRHHNEEGLTNFPNMGEYGLINKIPYDKFWHKMEQHGGAENGYMIYCDGMSSSGQVAAISLSAKLCEGQKMYFSGYVGNPANVGNKAKPNFLFSVQGSTDGTNWKDITSYLTGDLQPSDQWYQIYFPIELEHEYDHARVRIYNMASEDDGNDFIIDDMCIFATKPPLMVYQANTTCKIENEGDSTTHVVLRVDYQGFNEDMYEADNAYYCIDEVKAGSSDTTFVQLEDGYYDEHKEEDQRPTPYVDPAFKVDTLYGIVPMPERHYEPMHEDSIFVNLQELIKKFEESLAAHEKDKSVPVFRQGYIYEHLDDSIRPVMYFVHTAKMAPENEYIVHMAGAYKELRSSHCAMTSRLKVRNHMMLELNGEEFPDKEVTNMCANTTYEISLRVRGTLLMDSVAPIDINGSCFCDWLLYDDTAAVSSKERYGYKYSDIEMVIKNILRTPDYDNSNQFARSMSEINRNVLLRVQRDRALLPGVNIYNMLDSLVSAGFLTLYKSKLTVTTRVNDSIQYTIFPIEGTGSEVMQNMNIEVCPTPVHIKLKSSLGQGLPMIVGGLHRPKEEERTPITVLADELVANTEFRIPIDSIMMEYEGITQKVAIDTILMISTDDPEFLENIDKIVLVPDRLWEGTDHAATYYQNHGDTLRIIVSPETNYHLRPGYRYTFGFDMMKNDGSHKWGEDVVDDCEIGTVPFTLAVVPNYLRWDPQRPDDNRWNNPDNWIGINQQNEPIHPDARFAPLNSTYVVIPPMTDGKPYPVLAAMPLPYKDSIQMVGFQYNTCYSIRFMSGAALSQQQQMKYDSVIADLSLPQDKWALRSSPIEGMISGDLFMSDADLTWHTSPWEVGPFDAHGRTYATGNASYWISFFNQETTRIGNKSFEADTVRSADDAWSKVTNSMTEPLRPGKGWAVYTHTASGRNAAVRLPKNDDIYYFFTKSGSIVYSQYESNLRALRASVASSPERVGKLAYTTAGQSFTLTNGSEANSFVFGNPTMGYIDIWGFIADNTGLTAEIRYVNAEGNWQTATRDALSEPDTVTSLSRYLPPMHGLMLTISGDPATEITVILNASRIVTEASQIARPAPVPSRRSSVSKGLMTVTAINPVSPRCTSRLILGQGFRDAVIPGEDAVLTTVNIENYTNNTNPATPFNIYASEGSYGLSIDLMDSIVNVPISFVMTPLPYDETTQLWFTGVNNIDGELVLYDAFTGTERTIVDGIRLDIETLEVSHTPRYYIRRPGYNPDAEQNPVATGIQPTRTETSAAVKIVRNGQVFILRDGQVYTIYGQQVR